MNEPLSPTAVIVDDHPLARMAIRGVLENSTLSSSKSLKGGCGPKGLTKTAVDIVVVDVEIPGINGVELVEKLRAQRFTGVLIVVSAKRSILQ
jgi:two-component system response regulator EvgA